MDDLYRENIIDHFRHPRHKGHLDAPDVHYHDVNPFCGDEITIELKLDGDRIVDVAFDGKGCAISQASASMLIEKFDGKTVDEVRRFSAEEMLELFGAKLTPNRQKCCLLPWRVLQSAVFSPVKPAERANGKESH